MRTRYPKWHLSLESECQAHQCCPSSREALLELFSAGADVLARNGAGQTPRELAAGPGNAPGRAPDRALATADALAGEARWRALLEEPRMCQATLVRVIRSQLGAVLVTPHSAPCHSQIRHAIWPTPAALACGRS